MINIQNINISLNFTNTSNTNNINNTSNINNTQINTQNNFINNNFNDNNTIEINFILNFSYNKEFTKGTISVPLIKNNYIEYINIKDVVDNLKKNDNINKDVIDFSSISF